MEIIYKLRAIGYAFMIGVFMFACSQETQEGTTAEANEVHTSTPDATVVGDTTAEDNDYRELATWVEEKASRAETVTEEEWKELKAEYKRKEEQLDQKSNTWDDKAKQEWQDLKNTWKKTEEKVESRFKGTEKQ